DEIVFGPLDAGVDPDVLAFSSSFTLIPNAHGIGALCFGRHGRLQDRSRRLPRSCDSEKDRQGAIARCAINRYWPLLVRSGKPLISLIAEARFLAYSPPFVSLLEGGF